jgi:hypothetical protein
MDCRIKSGNDDSWIDRRQSSARLMARPDGSRDCVLPVSDGRYGIKSRARMGLSREDKFMMVEIEYCGQ